MAVLGGDIERSLERDDAEFIVRIRTFETANTSRPLTCATRITIAGLVLTIVGFVASPPLGATGVLVAITGLALRLAAPVFTSTFTPTVQRRPDDGRSSTGHYDTQA